MKKGFTLAEVLITLAIIGVVAAVSIPSVISNSNQQQYKTGLKKAVSVLNSAITMGMAKEGVSPYDLSADYRLFDYLQKHMNVLKSTTDVSTIFMAYDPGILAGGYINNSVFYTADGMRFEFYKSAGSAFHRYELYEGRSTTGGTVYPNLCYGYPNASSCPETQPHWSFRCGSYGLSDNINKTVISPCLITVDVNGDRKPNPANVNCRKAECAEQFKYADPNGIRLTDSFTIMITDRGARPYGVAAQRAMYSGTKKK